MQRSIWALNVSLVIALPALMALRNVHGWQGAVSGIAVGLTIGFVVDKWIVDRLPWIKRLR